MKMCSKKWEKENYNIIIFFSINVIFYKKNVKKKFFCIQFYLEKMKSVSVNWCLRKFPFPLIEILGFEWQIKNQFNQN